MFARDKPTPDSASCLNAWTNHLNSTASPSSTLRLALQREVPVVIMPTATPHTHKCPLRRFRWPFLKPLYGTAQIRYTVIVVLQCGYCAVCFMTPQLITARLLRTITFLLFSLRLTEVCTSVCLRRCLSRTAFLIVCACACARVYVFQAEEIPELEIDIDELLELSEEGQRSRLQVSPHTSVQITWSCILPYGLHCDVTI